MTKGIPYMLSNVLTCPTILIAALGGAKRAESLPTARRRKITAAKPGLSGWPWAWALAYSCLLGSLAPSPLQAQNITLAPVITTVAGNGTAAYNGDNIPATSAQLNWPAGVAVDSAGNLYIVDYDNQRIRKVDARGNITTVAGTGTPGYNGDNIAATSAELDYPGGVTVDSAGNVYIADSFNYRIRKVDTGGTITTVAGGGSGCAGQTDALGDGCPATSAELSVPAGVAVDSAGNLYIADYDNDRIRKVNASGIITTVAGNGSYGYNGDNFAATRAELNFPSGVAVDSAGNLYIADRNNQRIRKVDASGTITTVAGTGISGYNGDNIPATSAQLNYPNGVAVDSAGNLYIADWDNNTIRKVDASTGIISTVAGNGTAGYNGDNIEATSAELNSALGVAVDSAGNLYIADRDNNRIRKVTTGPVNFGQVNVGAHSTQTIILSINSALTLATVVASGDYSVQSDSCTLNVLLPANTLCTLQVQFAPTAPGPRWFALVATDSGGNKYSFGLEGTGVGSALAFTPGIITTVAGNGTAGYNGDNIVATSAELSYPWGVAVDSAGNLYIDDQGNGRIRKVEASGNITTVAGNGISGYNGDNIPATSAELNAANDVAVDSAGNLYIADYNNNRLRKVDTGGTITTVAGAGSGCAGQTDAVGDGCPATSAELNNPSGVAVDSAGNLYIADYGNQRIRKVDTGGTITTVAGTGTGGYNGDNIPATSAELYYPYGVAVDSAENLYIVDFFNGRIRKVDASGIITTVAGNGRYGYNGDNIPATSASLTYPTGVAVDSAGNLYIADYYNERIRKVDASGIITTVAGNGPTGPGGYNGDNIPATSAELAYPIGVAVDSAGKLYIADSDNNRIRKVDVTTSVLSFGSLEVGQTSGAQSVAVSDVGNVPLNFSSLLPSSNFLLQTVGNDCAVGTPLAVGATCELGVAFAPSVAGNPLTGTLTVSDDAFNTPQSISLSGIAIGTPTASLSATSLSFGNQLVGTPSAAQTVTLTNNGTAALTISSTVATGDFALSNNTCSSTEGPGGICTLSITFTPTASGLRNGVLTLMDNAGSGSQSVCLSGTGIALSGAITVAPAPVNFGQVNMGAKSTQSVLLSVNVPLTLATVVASGDYSVQSDSCALNTLLPANTLCTLQVQFAPSAPGPRWFALVATDSNSNIYSFGLEGTGVGSALAFTPGIISTLAGTGTGGYDGDNIPATSAELDYPGGVAVDSAGNLYISDTYNQRVRMVSTSGTITTVAGTGYVGPNGIGGYNGDNIAATSAELNYPYGLAVDSAGNLYIADVHNQRVRMVSTSGTITTVAGNGTPGYNGDNIAATSAELNLPGGVALDSAGNLYIVDSGNSRIRKVDLSGTITTVAGNGMAGYNGDNIAATSAELYSPFGVAVDSAGNLYISQYSGQRLRKVDSSGIITTVAGTGTAGYNGDNIAAISAELNYPTGVAVDSAGNLYIADSNQRLRKVDASGIITTVAGTGTGGYNGDNIAATSAEIYYPEGVAVDSAGNLYIADLHNSRIRKVGVTTSALSFASLNVGQSSAAQSVAVSDVGNAPLNFSSLLASSNFLLQSVGNDCAVGTALAVGATCQLGVAFAPSVAGNLLTGSVTLSDDAFNTPQSVSLSGIGVWPALTITASSPTMTYGGTVPTISPMYNPASPTLSTNPTCNAYVSPGNPVTSSTPPGTYTTSCTGGVGDYAITYVSGTLTVNPAPLTVTPSPNPASMTYGGALPTLTPSYIGFVNGDSPSSLTSAPTCSAPGVTSSSPVGSYTTSCTGAVDSNYNISSPTGTLRVNPATLTVTPSPNPASMTYGGPLPTLTPSYSGFVNGTVTVPAAPNCTTTVTTSSPVGTYNNSSCSGGTPPANYTFSYATGSVTVNTATLTVTPSPNPASMTYGGPLPTLTPSYSGFVNGTVTVPAAPNCTTTVTTSSGVGTYAKSSSCSGGTPPANYTFSYATGSVTVNPANTTATITFHRPNPSTVGQGVTVSFTVSPVAPAKVTPAGNVTVSDGVGDTCVATVATGQCNLTINTAGRLTLTATYAGGGNYNGSTSPGVAQRVNKALTQSAITLLSPNPSVVGQTVAINFTVTPVAPGGGTPAGNVTVSDLFGDSCTATVEAGTCSITFAIPGPKILTASYTGDSNYHASLSPPVTQNVIDFGISAGPPAETVSPGRTTTYSVTLTPEGGFTGKVGLACTGAPADSTFSISPGSPSLSGPWPLTATATVTTSRSTPLGTYTLTFTGVSGSGSPSTGGLTHSASVTLTVR
jgi:sugar lactone lactonase YvrE